MSSLFETDKIGTFSEGFMRKSDTEYFNKLH